MTRTLIFKDIKELERRIEEYWEYCETKEKPITMSGLAFYLGIDRRTLLNYSKRDAYFPTIKKARDRVEMDTEERLQETGQPTTGIIFALKNNYDWTDKKEVDQKVEGVNIVFKRD